MPATIETFESRITRIKNQKSERASQALDVLKWTFLAKRPLTVIELRHAFSVTIDFNKMQHGKLQLPYNKSLDWDNLPSEKSLIHWCLGLVTIHEKTSTVRLVHNSLHNYLTLSHEKGEIFPNGHSEIAYKCLQCMFFDDDKHKVDPSERIVTSRIKDLRRTRFHLLEYATNNFRHHLRDHSSITVDMIRELFPDRINLDCISTGFRSQFLSPFYKHRWRWDVDNNIHTEHEYVSTSQIHLRL